MKIHEYNEMMRYLTRPKDKKFVYEPWANKKVERLNTGGAVGAVPEALRDMLRVLKPAGRVLVLEFSMPTGRIMRAMYLVYLRYILPRVGGLLSGDSEAYRYLNRTIESFPCGTEFCDLMRKAGMVNVESFPLTFGVATIYKGEKAAA